MAALYSTIKSTQEHIPTTTASCEEASLDAASNILDILRSLNFSAPAPKFYDPPTCAAQVQQQEKRIKHLMFLMERDMRKLDKYFQHCLRLIDFVCPVYNRICPSCNETAAYRRVVDTGQILICELHKLLGEMRRVSLDMNAFYQKICKGRHLALLSNLQSIGIYLYSLQLGHL